MPVKLAQPHTAPPGRLRSYLYELLHCCFQDAEASAEMTKFFERRRHQQQLAGKMLRQFKAVQKAGACSKEEAKKAMAELKRAKRALAAEIVSRQESDAQLKAMKAFDPEMLGQGKYRGGNTGHRKQRMDFMERVKAQYPPLRPELANNWGQFKQKFDERHCRIIGFEGKSYGSWFLNEMKVLLTKRQEGSLVAFQEWIELKLERNPAMFVGHVKV